MKGGGGAGSEVLALQKMEGATSFSHAEGVVRDIKML